MLDDFFPRVKTLKQTLKDLYLSDSRPWVLACSYGKDSTAVLQLVWQVLLELPPDLRTKPVHVITSDTGVENPIMWAWIEECHRQVAETAIAVSLPIRAHKTEPTPDERFWANLIGRGYSRPSIHFRWCTRKMKIAPNTRLLGELASVGAIVFLGTRSAESQNRARSMERLNPENLLLVPSSDHPNTHIATPIADWTTNETWIFLLSTPPGFRPDNKKLRQLYANFSSEGECSLVVDTETDPCGARSGCWTCTVVKTDSSFRAAVEDDPEREWMIPLLEFRDELALPDHERRDFRRLNGRVDLYEKNGEMIPTPGPYTREWRHRYLRRVLEIQRGIEESAPPPFNTYQIITHPELEEIRRLWCEEKYEWEDALPQIYREVMGRPFLTRCLPQRVLDGEDWAVLRECCPSSEELDLLTGLLGVEQKHSLTRNRTGIFGELERIIETRRGTKEERVEEEKLKKALKSRDSEQLKITWKSLKFKDKTDANPKSN